MRKYILLLIGIIAICIDTTAKYFAELLLTWRSEISIVSDFIQFNLSYNSGVAFSLPIHGLPLQIITIVLIVGLFYYFFREEYPKNKRFLDIGYTLILAGAISHGYERIFVWHVVDFIAVKYFAILNFADIFISIGAFLIILSYVMNRKHR